jgi:hypothetical protein
MQRILSSKHTLILHTDGKKVFCDLSDENKLLLDIVTNIGQSNYVNQESRK